MKKFENILYEWYKMEATAQMRVNSIMDSDSTEFVVKTLNSLDKIKAVIKEIEDKIKKMEIEVDFEKVKNLAVETEKNNMCG